MKHIIEFLISYVLVLMAYFLDSGRFRPFAALIMILVLTSVGYLVGKLYDLHKRKSK